MNKIGETVLFDLTKKRAVVEYGSNSYRSLFGLETKVNRCLPRSVFVWVTKISNAHGGQSDDG